MQLAFTPVVLSAGRISLKVRSEVSEISGTRRTESRASRTRRAETTVEQPSGGAFVIAGLLQQNTQRAVSGFPGLQKLPILGALFSSKNFLVRETELVMIVTPYLVKPTSPSALARPDRNTAPTSDAEAYFLNRLTKVYGTEESGSRRTRSASHSIDGRTPWEFVRCADTPRASPCGPASPAPRSLLLAVASAGCTSIAAARHRNPMLDYDSDMRHPILISDEPEVFDLPVGMNGPALSPRDRDGDPRLRQRIPRRRHRLDHDPGADRLGERGRGRLHRPRGPLRAGARRRAARQHPGRAL